jgi:hypothetical protein
LSQHALLPRVFQAYILVHASLLDIHLLLDISWADLRAAMCPLQHIVGQAVDSEAVKRLIWFVAQHLSPEMAIRQLLLECAKGCMILMKKGHWDL